ncbi:hypothetical protein [Lentilactobacillus kribbianus]|uniref:hypothetical protein n=1 Tax=Lentilactobacillus kribbianus TaxID=2729622 RepID=UPI0015543E83|nr:hypothetical protein [Lentilactobacillus kribbianus]
MLTNLPTNVTEFQEMLAVRRVHAPEVTEVAFFNQVLVESMQRYLETAEEGHYDTARFQAPNLEVVGLTGKVVKVVPPLHENFLVDFKNNADEVFGYLEDEAQKIAVQ